MFTDQQIQKAAEVIGTSKTRTYRVKNYRSSSGRRSDITFTLLPTGGYQELVRASLEWLHNHPPSMDPVISEARAELAVSWNKTLLGAHDVRGNTQLQSNQRGFMVDPDKPNRLVLMHLLRIGDEEVLEEPALTGRERGSAPKTIEKSAMTKAAPLGGYIGQLNLEPGKFDSIEAL
jgi:hypothetical protein